LVQRLGNGKELSGGGEMSQAFHVGSRPYRGIEGHLSAQPPVIINNFINIDLKQKVARNLINQKESKRNAV